MTYTSNISVRSNKKGKERSGYNIEQLCVDVVTKKSVNYKASGLMVFVPSEFIFRDTILDEESKQSLAKILGFSSLLIDSVSKSRDEGVITKTDTKS
jgi:hypothetical protein